MGRFHEILENEHIEFTKSFEGQSLIFMKGEINNSEEYVSVPKKFLEDLKDFDYWKEWKHTEL